MHEDSKPKRGMAKIKDAIVAESNDLEAKVFNLSKALSNATIIIGEKDQEITDLKKLLDSCIPKLDSVLKISDEEVIASIQIAELKKMAMQRPLTLEETKIFDLMVKNKRISQEMANEIVDVKGLPANTPKSELLRLASKKLKS